MNKNYSFSSDNADSVILSKKTFKSSHVIICLSG